MLVEVQEANVDLKDRFRSNIKIFYSVLLLDIKIHTLFIVFQDPHISLLYSIMNFRGLIDSITTVHKYRPSTSLTFAACGDAFLQVTSIPTVINTLFITHQTVRDVLPIPALEVSVITAI